MEEKQRLKRAEQLKKMKEDAEDEEKWRTENNKHLKQSESVRERHKERQVIIKL